MSESTKTIGKRLFSSSEITECKYRSSFFKHQEIHHEWRINEYRNQIADVPNGQFIRSNKFYGKCEETFSIKAYPNGITEDCENYFSVSLECHGPNPEFNVEIKYDLSTTVSNYEGYFASEYKFQQTSDDKMSDECCYKKFFERPSDFYCTDEDDEEPEEVLLKETLVIGCTITIHCPTVLEKIFRNPKYWDFTIEVGNESLRVHKAILSAESSVFAAMFDSDMVENQQNKCAINDFDYEVIKGMIEFMYIGHCANMNEIAAELFIAADKYNLLELKNLCEDSLCSQIWVTNVPNMLVLADHYNAKKLKTATLDFFKRNVKDVINAESWKSAKLPDYVFKDVISCLGNHIGEISPEKAKSVKER